MQVYFWGTRGSLPATVTVDTIRSKLKRAIKEAQQHQPKTDEEIERFIDEQLPFDVRGSFGCNTSCTEIRGGSEYMVCDAGSGLRDFGRYAMAQTGGKAAAYNIFISHPHWDHIQGFPFFIPAYIPGNQVTIYGFHPDLEAAFIRQQEAPCFPVPFAAMRADFHFVHLEEGNDYDIAGLTVRGVRQDHPGGSFGYCFEGGGKKIVYSTDAEHREESVKGGYYFLDFIRQADLLIFDAQYNLLDSVSLKENWGHSSNMLGVELAVMAGVKYLCLYHNEHTCDDEALERFLGDTRRYVTLYDESSTLAVDLAYDGLLIEV